MQQSCALGFAQDTWSGVLGVCMALKEPGGPLAVLQNALDAAGGLNAAQGEFSPSEIAENGRSSRS